MFGGEASHLPLKINTSGVIPPIFASSLLLLPATVANFEANGQSYGWLGEITAYLAHGTGLNLVTPSSYLKAISEGTDPSAADKAEVQNEIASRSIKVFIFNSQNSTPDIQGLVDKATAQGIPVVKITETLAPATATFQDWQTAQLKDLLHALGG